jgi:hypothetical protein
MPYRTRRDAIAEAMIWRRIREGMMGGMQQERAARQPGLPQGEIGRAPVDYPPDGDMQPGMPLGRAYPQGEPGMPLGRGYPQGEEMLPGMPLGRAYVPAMPVPTDFEPGRDIPPRLEPFEE